MHHIKNLTNSPYDIRVKGGKVARLPARGEITVDIDPMHLPLYRTLGYFQITEGKPKAKRQRKPKAPPDPALVKLREEYADLFGTKPYMGWKAAEIQKRIDAKLEE
ncbi:hypothetical protein [Nitratireductor sp. GCM10026969]|uniref:hypothetical protein n=1 Tax=Nitratireductor sp. GCM10026969 TaxID=3252645 RepID=UPI00360B91D2